MPAPIPESLRQMWRTMGTNKTQTNDFDFSDGIDLSGSEPGSPIKLRSPDGTVFSVSVTDDGTLDVTETT